MKPSDLARPIERMCELAEAKTWSLHRSWNPESGAPVVTRDGKYTSRAWTQWTQGFQYGMQILCFDATSNADLLAAGKRNTLERMSPHVTHVGVHDHGFNNISTYGNLRRLMREGRIEQNEWELHFYELAIKASGAVQGARWAGVPAPPPTPRTANTTSLGYIYSFNGPHSLFVDTMRTLRSLGVAWQLGQKLFHENDRAADLLKRSVLHALCTKQFLLFSW